MIMDHVPDQDAADEILRVLLGEISKTRHTFVYEPLQGDQVTRSEFVRWARSLDYDPLIVWVQTDEATAAKRSRQNGVDKTEYDDLVRKFVAPHAIERPLVISGKHTQSSQTRTVLKRISDNQPSEAVKVPVRDSIITQTRVR